MVFFNGGQLKLWLQELDLDQIGLSASNHTNNYLQSVSDYDYVSFYVFILCDNKHFWVTVYKINKLLLKYRMIIVREFIEVMTVYTQTFSPWGSAVA